MRRILFTAVFCLTAVPFGAMVCRAQDAPAQVVPPSLIFELLALNHDLETAANPKYLSPTALIASPDRKFIYLAEQTAKQVAVVDVTTSAVIRTFPLPNEPTGLAIAPTGSPLYVTCSSERWPAGIVCVVDAGTGKVQKRIRVGHSARAPVISPDGSKLYVCNWYDNSVSVVDIAAGCETRRITTVREPYAAAITPDGATLVVTNALPDQKSTDTVNLGCKISLIATASGAITASIPLPHGANASHSVYGLCLSPDGKYAFATHLIGRTNLPAITLTAGWVHSNNLAVIDLAKKSLANDIELDDMNHGAASPWGLACTADGNFLCVLHAGSNELTIIDLPKMLAKAIGQPDLSHSFTTLQGICRRTALTGKNPRSIAIIGAKAYIAGYFANAIDVVDVCLSGAGPAASIAVGTDKPMTSQRMGEYRFSDASLCFQTWQSCNSCHPFTRPDALNWILAQTVNNAPKNVLSHLFTFQTPPMNWSGRRPDAFESVKMGIRLEQQLEPLPEWYEPLDTFLMRLKPLPSPSLVKGRLSPAAQRGKELYFRTTGTTVDCQTCHPAPLFTDNKLHNAGVPDPFDPSTSFDTPTLIEVWRTGPYNHIGSSVTLEEIIKLPGHSNNVYRLSPQDFNDLLEYVKSL